MWEIHMRTLRTLEREGKITPVLFALWCEVHSTENVSCHELEDELEEWERRRFCAWGQFACMALAFLAIGACTSVNGWTLPGPLLGAALVVATLCIVPVACAVVMGNIAYSLSIVQCILKSRFGLTDLPDK